MGASAAGIVAVTDGIKDLLVRDFGVAPEKVRVLPNGVDLEEFTPMPRAQAALVAGLDPALSHVVFTGLFADWVDFATMLRGFALVAVDRPGARLVLVGDGAQRHEVEDLIDDLCLRDRVLLTGFVADRALMRAYIGAAVVCIGAWRLERRGHIGVSPVKLAEYMACARAVVAGDVPGVHEMIEGSGAGRVVAQEPEAMAKAIAELLDDPGRADAVGRAGRRAAEMSYSWQSVVERTLPLLTAPTPARTARVPASR
jgi:glycosyltransferase involved in cell wall biosynthesis